MAKTTDLTLEKAKKIKLLAFDVDGVMTDGSVTYDENGVEYKLCALCEKAVEARAVEATGHVYDDETDTVCNACGYGGIIRGDVNGDGVVETADAIYLVRHILTPSRYPINQSGDMNADGVESTDDAIYLLRYVLNHANYPLK